MANTSSGGIGLGTALFLVFLVLKLTDHIDWSWWWVTAPLWGGFALVVGTGLLTALVAFPVLLISKAGRQNGRGRSR